MIHPIKIVFDSASDLLELPDVDSAMAPLKIITAEKEYVDDASLDVVGMTNDLLGYKGRSSTSCPNLDDWLRAFGDGEKIVCVTITGTLSGSYNTACLAKEQYEELHPDRRVFVLNSLSAGPEIALILEKARECVLAGMDFDAVCHEITAYSHGTGLMFVLESLKNLANNGRVSPMVARLAGLLDIRIVGKAGDKGDLEPLDKSRGERRSLEALVKRMKEQGYAGGKVRISHCLNERAAVAVRTLLQDRYPSAEISMYPSRGLCSFYAERGGLLVGFEKA